MVVERGWLWLVVMACDGYLLLGTMMRTGCNWLVVGRGGSVRVDC